MSDTIQVDLGRGYFTTVDADLWERRLRHYKWKVMFGGGRLNRNKKPYAYTHLGCTYGMHRMIMNPPMGLHVDHINGDSLDNRRANLRLCTRSQNGANVTTPTRNKTNYKGLWWCPSIKKWGVGIKCKGVRYHVGFYGRPIDAARAYDQAALALHGEFARLNLPNEECVPKMPKRPVKRVAKVSQSATLANGSTH